MEKGKHPVYQYWPWMLAAATVLLAAWAVCETLAIFATGGYTRELAVRALAAGLGSALWVPLAAGAPGLLVGGGPCPGAPALLVLRPAPLSPGAAADTATAARRTATSAAPGALRAALYALALLC